MGFMTKWDLTRDHPGVTPLVVTPLVVHILLSDKNRKIQKGEVTDGGETQVLLCPSDVLLLYWCFTGTLLMCYWDKRVHRSR